MAADERKRRLSKAKKGLIEGLTRLVHDAAGELVTNALIGLDESPGGGERTGSSASSSRGSSSGVATPDYPSRVYDGQIGVDSAGMKLVCSILNRWL